MTTDVSLEDQIAEVRRELSARRRLYPRWVARGLYPQDVLDRRLVAMEAVLATLRGRVQPELALDGE